MTTGALGALRFLADAATFAAAALSKAALLTVAAVERTDGGGTTGYELPGVRPTEWPQHRLIPGNEE